MKQYPGIDYKQHPASYWQAEENVLELLLRNVKGTARRHLITECWNAGRVEQLGEELLKETLSDKAREALSQLHPHLMGGEYLPDYGASEAEIARIELQSTTSDVISIRARKCGKRIAYRIVDEYETEFDLQRKSSREPLTLAELVEFIDGSAQPDLSPGLALCYNEMNAEDRDRSRYRHFTSVSSEFYPQLSEHYEHVYDDWVAAQKTGCG